MIQIKLIEEVNVDTFDVQPSLAGLFVALISTQDWRPGLLSAVPSGLVPIHLESYLFSAISFSDRLIRIAIGKNKSAIGEIAISPEGTAENSPGRSPG
jgi:hypothetical protein